MDASTDNEDSSIVKESVSLFGFPPSLEHHEGMEVEGASQSNSEASNSQWEYSSSSSSGISAPELKISRHDPVYGHESSYGVRHQWGNGGRPMRKRDRSQEALTNSFEKAVTVSSPRSHHESNCKRFRSEARYIDTPSPEISARFRNWKTPDTLSAEISNDNEEEKVDSVDYAKMNNILRDLRLSRERRKKQEPSPATKAVSTTSVCAPTTPCSSSSSSSSMNILEFQQKHILDYQRRQKSES